MYLFDVASDTVEIHIALGSGTAYLMSEFAQFSWVSDCFLDKFWRCHVLVFPFHPLVDLATSWARVCVMFRTGFTDGLLPSTRADSLLQAWKFKPTLSCLGVS